MADDGILDKIKKCMALSKSANEHEAAAALRQAQALMKKHRISEDTVLASHASEAHATSGTTVKTTAWENGLANKVASIFGCTPVFLVEIKHHKWAFIGTGSNPEIAAYCFAVLLRQLKKARSAYIQAKLKRCKPATKTRRGDLYCRGWVVSAVMNIPGVTLAEDEAKAISHYMALNYGTGLSTSTGIQRTQGQFSQRDLHDMASGHADGKSANVSRAVGASGAQANLLEH